MEITECGPGDIPIVSPLLFRAVQGSAAAFSSVTEVERTLLEATREAGRSPWCALVARGEGEILGVAVSGPPVSSGLTAQDAELRMLAALPTGQGRRIGERLVEHLIGALRARGKIALYAQGRVESLASLTAAGAVIVRSLPSERVLSRLQVDGAVASLSTARLRLRDWQPSDVEPYVRLCQDPEVMQFLPPQTAEQCLEQVETFHRSLMKDGFGIWAVEKGDTGEFVGFTGIKLNPRLPFAPAPELAYRLARAHFGLGIATEAAQAALDYAFGLGFGEVCACTVPANTRSQAVMRRVGMSEDLGGSFRHPSLPLDHPLSAHVLFRKKNPHL
ncbi:MAG: hypothetical protein B6A08_12715 [Sorangiineae bacterium NIC37A_2]|nr:MAG: hypothetical protein B6A08_12715 [Sorangiineae bacterium NIC37A_2]